MYDAQTLANLSIVVSLAFLLKAHLKALYQLSEDKCRKYEPAGKKSAIGDKPTARKAGVPLVLDLEPVPFALRPVETLGDVFEQCSAVSWPPVLPRPASSSTTRTDPVATSFAPASSSTSPRRTAPTSSLKTTRPEAAGQPLLCIAPLLQLICRPHARPFPLAKPGVPPPVPPSSPVPARLSITTLLMPTSCTSAAPPSVVPGLDDVKMTSLNPGRARSVGARVHLCPSRRTHRARSSGRIVADKALQAQIQGRGWRPPREKRRTDEQLAGARSLPCLAQPKPLLSTPHSRLASHDVPSLPPYRLSCTRTPSSRPHPALLAAYLARGVLALERQPLAPSPLVAARRRPLPC